MNASRLFIALLVASALQTACTVYPARPPYDDRPVRIAPPPPRYESPGYPPVAGYLWITGYWTWVGVRYEWVPGYWVAPRPGYLWIPHRWERDGDHWRMQGGRWERDERGAPPVEHRDPRRADGPARERFEAGPRPRDARDDDIRPHREMERDAHPTFRDAPEPRRPERREVPDQDTPGLARPHQERFDPSVERRETRPMERERPPRERDFTPGDGRDGRARPESAPPQRGTRPDDRDSRQERRERGPRRTDDER